MALTAEQHGFTVLAVLCAILALWYNPVSSAMLPPNPLPPSNPRCVDYPSWSTPIFLPKNCYTALALFSGQEVEKHLTRPFEFIAPRTRPLTSFDSAATPRKYFYVMLDFFDPRDLGLESWATFSPRDIATFADVAAVALRVANSCLSKYSPSTVTGDSITPVGFTSDLGFGSVGEWVQKSCRSPMERDGAYWLVTGLAGSIGVFFFATDSKMEQKLRA
ncbi:MAG: hypothetical protein Q9197_004788, partial [Variospora fuerteventurae]